MSIVDVQQLTHYYGDKLVFKDIQFRLFNSEHVGLVGPNGAGKSTLLRILSGAILPDHGSITWLPQTQIGYLEQHFDLTPGVSVQDYLRTAFQFLYDAEQEMLELSMKMSDANANEMEGMLSRFAEIQDLLDHHDFYLIDSKIEEVATGLGITALGLETNVELLSGGQRTKLLLGKLLLQEPTVLLLDEPTNYLDFGHISWLKDYLRSYPHAFILISHDIDFLNEVVNVIFHLEHKQLTRYVGNYSKFVEAYELSRRQIYVEYEKQQEEIQKLETYVQKNKVRASTAKQAKAREKKLGKIDRIEKPIPTPKPRFSFQVSEKPTSTILELVDLEIGYDYPLLPPMSFTFKRGEKVAITGYNGIGKSTTLKTLIGELQPLKGRVTLGEGVHPAYFAQEWNTTLIQTPLEYIWSLHETMTQKEIRQALARSGMRTDHILKPLNTLSGGEQTRVRLCHLMLLESNLLILDEPTNHLDVRAKESLAKALEQYEGTVIVVSHEPEFYKHWVTDIWDLEQWA